MSITATSPFSLFRLDVRTWTHQVSHELPFRSRTANAGLWTALPPLAGGKVIKLSPPVLAALEELKFTQVVTRTLCCSPTQMTHIQAACIPLFLDYKDVAAEAVRVLPHVLIPR